MPPVAACCTCSRSMASGPAPTNSRVSPTTVLGTEEIVVTLREVGEARHLDPVGGDLVALQREAVGQADRPGAVGSSGRREDLDVHGLAQRRQRLPRGLAEAALPAAPRRGSRPPACRTRNRRACRRSARRSPCRRRGPPPRACARCPSSSAFSVSRTKLYDSAVSFGSSAPSSSTRRRTCSDSGSASACENTASRTGFAELRELLLELRATSSLSSAIATSITGSPRGL